MALKFLWTACLVVCVRAGDLLSQPLQQLAAPAPIAQIRYAPSAPIITKSTIYHTASAPASIAYHAPAPAALTYQAQAPAALTYHAPAPAHIAYPAPAPAVFSYQQAPQLVRSVGPAFTSYASPAISYPAPLVRTVAPAPAFVKAIAPAPAPAFIKSVVTAPALVKTIQPISVPAPALIKAQPAEEYDPNPQYSFGYDVQDSLTGDVKSQSETRNGDSVQGSYALNEPDGTRRIVDYTADPINGFNAVIRKEPLAQKALIHAAPVKIAAPAIAYGAPIAKLEPLPLAAPAPAIALPSSLAYSAPAGPLAIASPAHAAHIAH